MFLVLPSSSMFILTPCLDFTEVGLTMEADRIVQVDRTSIMEALRERKSWTSSGVAPLPKRLRFFNISTKEGSRIRGSLDRG